MSALDLAGLASPSVLAEPARLYATLCDDTGKTGPWRFLAELPAGSAVFALAAPGAGFLLTGRASTIAPRLEPGMPDGIAIDLWYAALLSCPGIPHGDGEALPLEPGERRNLTGGARVTARQVVWLQSEAPVLRYRETDEPRCLLVLADQVTVEVAVDSAIVTYDSGSLAARSMSAAGAASEMPAALIAAALRTGDAAERKRRRDVPLLDEARASHALQELRDIAGFQAPAAAASLHVGQDALADALAIIGAVEDFDLRAPAADDRDAPLFERLERFADVSGFRFREIALDGDWWGEEGPPFLAVEAANGRPLAVVWRRQGWHAVDPASRAETRIDARMAAGLLPRGYMFYASLPERVTMGVLRRFALVGSRRDLARVLIATAAVTLAGLLTPVATGAILGIAVPDGRLSLLNDMLLLLLAAAIGTTGFQIALATALIRFRTTVNRRLQAAVWDRVIRLRTGFFRRYLVGDLAQRIVGIDTIRRLLSTLTVNSVIAGVFSLAGLAVMAAYDLALTGFALVYAIVVAVVLFVLGRAQMRLERNVTERRGAVTSLLVETLGGIAKLRIAAAELRAFSRWSHGFARQRINSAHAGRLAAFQTIAATCLPTLGALGVFAIAAGGEHPLDVASFAAFNSAFSQFTAAILSLAIALSNSIEVVPLFDRLRPVLEAKLEVESSRVDPGRLEGGLTVRNLAFRYDDDAPWVLQDVEFEVRPGENFAIVGGSGSGKSTLLRLLLGFEAPVRGGVFYDGKDLERLDLRMVRRQIGTVLETSRLVPGSVYDNIAGSAPLPRERVMEAARLAGLEADVAAMPMGLETLVMEGGAQLSGGQRQRLMIARALVRHPRLIFLDEATSALDNRTQAIVGQSIAAMNATRIVIAHRLSTVRDADRILVLDRGRIAEIGTYDELIERGGAFHRLAQRQLL
ncbi:NHLM bacteriocin system ABC transporter, ATP-binding protein [Rhodospirillales bacterium URHD0017]|nr:NHLM bacteriocin system ABC transporter, ATP-binding protein [Rhodospirillales bacterium URHD0017]